MFALPTWLSTLQRVREHRRDAALQSLAHRLRTAIHVREATNRVAELISQLRERQPPSGRFERLDPARLRQLRQERDELQSQLIELRRQQLEADAAVRQAQSFAASQESDVEVLRRLEDRLVAAHQQNQQRRDEETVLEAALSLCNGSLSD